MPGSKRISHPLVLIAAVALLGMGTGYFYLAQSLPLVDGRLAIRGLRAPVEVVRDQWGVPHIYAQNEHDLFFAQGYVQAQDRLWQMELRRRAARGTLAEVFGDDALASDQLARTLGLAAAAQADWEALTPEERSILEAYASGVSAFFSSPAGQLPIEFSLLDYEPDPWEPLDTLALARLFAWSQDSGWQAELLRARLVRAVGPERAGELDPTTAGAPGVLATLSGLAAVEEPLLLESLGPEWPWASAAGVGGDSWAVAGVRAEGGRPILAAASHTPVEMPSPWYEMHLIGGRYDVVGATLPGLPCVLIGRNRYVAWGLAGSTIDGMDLYVERVRPGDPPQAQYQGRWESVRVREEEIGVHGQAEPFHMRVYETRHGPLVTPLESGAREQLALRWAGARQPLGLLRSLPALNRASNWEEFQAALHHWTIPAQTWVYADVRGHIGYAVAAAVPDRSGGEGSVPVPGWTGENEWTGLLSPRVLPRALDAAEGSIAVADGAVAPEGWPGEVGDEAGLPEAGERIVELVAAADELTLEDAQRIQCDDRGVEPPLLSPLLARPPQGWLQERTLPYLPNWDLRYDAESAGAGVYEVFYWRLVHNTLDDELGADLVDAYLNTNSSHRAFMESLAARVDSPWFDDLRTPEPEGRDEIIDRSYAEALDWLGRRFGDLPYEWNWGRMHKVTFRHPLGQRWPLNLLFNRGTWPLGGAPGCVNATSPDYTRQLAVRTAPSYRLIVDLAAGGEALAINAPGQSGNPFSRHYADMIKPWQQGDYHPLLVERQAILQAHEGVLALAPAG